MKKQYFIRIINALESVDAREQRASKQGAENCAKKSLTAYDDGTVAIITDENESVIAVYSKWGEMSV